MRFDLALAASEARSVSVFFVVLRLMHKNAPWVAYISV